MRLLKKFNFMIIFAKKGMEENDIQETDRKENLCIHT